MSAPRVTVRMYRGLLGDCFMLRLFQGDGPVDRDRIADANILIDCGTIQGAPGGEERLKRVAASIAQDCGGHLDLVVVTHEHYDHLSGFGIAQDVFLDAGGIAIDHLWLAWTENPDDEAAIRLRQMFDGTRMAVGAGLDRMAVREAEIAAAKVDAPEPGGQAWRRDDFLGPLGVGAAGRLSVREILSRLTNRVQPAKDDYLEPGQARTTPGAVGLRAFVLGPPRDVSLLFKNLPSQSADDGETYLEAREDEAKATERNFAAYEAADDEDRVLKNMPFSRRHRQIADTALLGTELTPPDSRAPVNQRNLWAIRELYAGRDGRHDANPNAWRMIDTEWQEPIGALAMKLDADTNNTSLVLAFETAPGGDVLLFAADAQVGNWLSWHNQGYPNDAAPENRVSAADLLARTVLYKVGHHGSHNATLRASGLELMTDERLVAMLPNVKALAERRRWSFPHRELYERLLEKTSGRILAGDDAPDPAVLAADGDFAQRVREGPADDRQGSLWVEYDVV